MNRQDLADDARLQSNDGRVAHEEYIDRAIAGWVAERDLISVLEALDQAEVPASPIYSAAEIMSDPQFRARAMFLDGTLPDGTAVKLPGIIPKLSQTPGNMAWVGPELGQHTDEVLSAAGYDEGQLSSLREAGVVQ
jgi:crotonobetainyl-CoA:carnitine CoA-transferase CaiB-like acyl-CoA transferase